MNNYRVAMVLGLSAVVAGTNALAQSLPQVSGTVENYFLNNHNRRGFVNQLWWTELDARLTSNDKLTGSYILKPGGHSFDEFYYGRDFKDVSLRLGRMRTSFGLNSWADLFYNGFNSLPLVRSIPIVAGVGLGRDDSGVEATTHLGTVQIQAATVDVKLDRDQLLPESLNRFTFRAQQTFGTLIAGADYFSSYAGDQKIYGMDFRYTIPQLIMRGEAFWGVGEDASSGFYFDASYRLPSLYRTQVVARYDQVNQYEEKVAQLETLGLRQIVNRYLSLNLNYAFGSNLTSASGGPYSEAHTLAPTGWSARAMFQFSF